MRIGRWCVAFITLAACRPEAAPVPLAPRMSSRATRPVAPTEPVPAVAHEEPGRATTPTAPTIQYRVEQASGEEPGSESFSVVAERGGTIFAVSAPQGSSCLAVLLEHDLDGDGLEDALLEYGACGNCCPATYFFVPGTKADRFEAQELAAQWNSPELETWRGRASVVLETDNEGWNTVRADKVTRRFVFERGRAVIAEETHAVEVKALVDLRAEHFANAKLDAERSASFDLDGDRGVDKLVGTLWQRWGRILWHVEFADGRVSERGNHACKRLGVLAEKTMGYRDLVCDFDTRFSWNGEAYVIEEAP